MKNILKTPQSVYEELTDSQKELYREHPTFHTFIRLVMQENCRMENIIDFVEQEIRSKEILMENYKEMVMRYGHHSLLYSLKIANNKNKEL